MVLSGIFCVSESEENVKEIRTKPTSKKPKTLDKASRLPQKTKNTLVHARNKVKEIDTRDIQQTPENYAVDKIADKAPAAAQKGGEEAKEIVRQIAGRGKKAAKKRFYNTRKTESTVKKSAKGTIKTVDKGIKTAKHTVKATKRTIKTSKKAAKSAGKTAKATTKASVRTARAAAKAAVAGIKLLAKAIAAAVKAAATAIKSLVAVIAAGGWVVIVIIIVVGAILFIVNSSFGIFYSNEDTGEEGTIPMSQAVAEISGDYSVYVNQQILNASVGHDNVTVVYDGGIDGDSDTINNWVDVLGIYAVKLTTNEIEPMEVATVTEEKKQILKDLYYEMNLVSISVETIEETDPDDEEVEPVERTIVHVSMLSENYQEVAERYGFTEEQNDMLEELMAPENHYLFAALIGIDCYGGLTAQQLEEIRSSLPDDVGGDIVRAALTRIGDPYSQSKRGTDRYVDCSYLVRWAYNEAGVMSYKAATAAEQARCCVNNDMLISKDELCPGDVIFWRKNGCECGRYMEIHHVAIYIGSGEIIEASSGRGCVVINDIWGEDGGKWEILYYAHPYFYTSVTSAGIKESVNKKRHQGNPNP